MRRYLVVGNQTLRSARLLRELSTLTASAPCSFHLVVPAANPHVHAFWTEGEAHSVARERLDEAIAHMAEHGITATGHVGDANPIDAVSDSLLQAEYDAVIVSTLPPGLSRWIHQDLPRRIERRVELPVRHVITPFGDMRPEGRRELQEANQ
jgi:pentose-5-phosphate-3-epimerase